MGLFANMPQRKVTGGSGLDVVEALPVEPKDKQVVVDMSSGVPITKVYDETSGTWLTQSAPAPVGSASEVAFNKTGTTLTSNNVQDGIKELDDKIENIDIDSIDADKIVEDSNKVFVSPTERTQITTNKNSINNLSTTVTTQGSQISTLESTATSHTNSIVLLNANDALQDLSINDLTSNQYKVKGSSTDNSPDYLSAKVDGTTILVVNDKLVVKNIDGLTIGVADINNWLLGLDGNIKSKFDMINSTITSIVGGMSYYGKINTYADLANIVSPENGMVVVILNDETKDSGRTMYVYSSTLSNWDYIGLFEFTQAFLDLDDTPSSFIGQNNRILKVDEANEQIVFDQVNWNEIQNKPTSTITDIDDAVSKKHTHSNKALLDSYTQTESDLADSVAKKHEHQNKNILDKFSEVSGKLQYDGKDIESSSGGTGGGHVILNEGVPLPQRTNLEFQNMIVTDNIASDTTIVKPFTASGGKVVFENVSGTVASISQNEEISISHTEVEDGKISIEIWEKVDGTIGVSESVNLSFTVHEDLVNGTQFISNMISLKNRNSDKLTNLFNFDETSGNVTDLKGNAIGTVYGATRVVGWNGEGYALSFDGVDDYVQFNQPIFTTGDKTIRFKLYITSYPTGVGQIISSGTGSPSHGMLVSINNDKTLSVSYTKGTAGSFNLTLSSNSVIPLNTHHDVMITQKNNNVSLYINNMNTPLSTGVLLQNENPYTSNLVLGKQGSSGANYFKGQIDHLEVYNDVINPNTYDTTNSYYIVNKIVVADIQKINSLIVNGTEPTNTSRRFLISFDGKVLSDTTKQWIYSTDGITKLTATNGLDDLQSVGMTKAQLELLLANYTIVNEEMLDIVADLSTTDSSVSPTISGYTLNVDKKSTYKEVSDDSIYEIRQVSPKLSTVKRLVAGSKNILINVLSESKNSDNGNGGHLIQNNGIDMTQRDKLNFKGFTITDDTTNNATTIEVNASNKASDITVEDVNGNFVETKLEGVLAELFQVSDSVKSSYVNAIGLPLSTSDTNANNVTKLQQIKLKMATNLNNKDIPTLPSDSLDKMADDIALIPNVSLTGIKKVTKLNVVSPYQHQVILEQPLKLEDIATSVLKYVHGADNIVQYNAEYNNGENSSFNYNPNEVQFDGFMNIKDSWDYPLTTVGTDYFETGDIDFSQFTSYGGDATINVDELNVNIKGLKTTSAVVEASGDISLAGVESLDNINWLSTIGGNGVSKLAISFNGGISYVAYNGSEWITVNVNNAEDFKLNGMDKTTVDTLTDTELSIARDGSLFIRFAYYLERPIYVDVAKNDKIQLVVSMLGYNEIASNSVFNYSYNPLTKTLTYDFNQSGTYTITYFDAM